MAKKKPTYLTEDDFESPSDFELYLASLFAKRLNPKINQDFAFEAIKGFLAFLEIHGGLVGAQHVVDLADEILAGEAAGGMFH